MTDQVFCEFLCKSCMVINVKNRFENTQLQIINSNFNNVFNWTMTYRSDSDVTIGIWKLSKKAKRDLKQPDYHAKKTKLAVALISNCKNSERNKLVQKIKELAPTGMVDIFGNCGKPCFNDCREIIKDYKFVLSFENSFYCKDYITEKFWVNALTNVAVPVVKGAIKDDYLKLVPKNSFIYVDDFSNISQLVDYLIYLNYNPREYNLYHSWRVDYKIGTRYIQHWCDLCDKLHTDTAEKVYDNFENWYNSCKDFSV